MREISRLIRHPIEALFDLLPFGIVVVGRDRRIKWTNALGPVLLSEAEIQAAVTPNATVMRLPRGKQRPLELAIVPLRDCFALIAADQSRRVLPSCDRLRNLYGLTPAESRVVAALVGGASTTQAAADLEMSVNTLRRHLKRVFEKLSVKRQSEMVRVVATGVAALDFDRYDPNG